MIRERYGENRTESPIKRLLANFAQRQSVRSSVVNQNRSISAHPLDYARRARGWGAFPRDFAVRRQRFCRVRLDAVRA